MVLRRGICFHVQLASEGLSTNHLQDLAGGPRDPEESNAHRLQRIRKKFQRVVRRELDSRSRVDPVARMRHKLGRYALSGLPGITAPRCVRSLQILETAVSPRVAAAVLRTLWNGWTTSHRFQGSETCVLRCSEWAQDKLEHYAVCPCIRKFGRTFLNLQRGPANCQLGQFIALGLNDAKVADEELVRRAIWVYSAYRAVMEVSHNGYGSQEEVQDMLKQFAREAVRGHSTSTAILDGCFVNWNSHSITAFEASLDEWQEDI